MANAGGPAAHEGPENRAPRTVPAGLRHGFLSETWGSAFKQPRAETQSHVRTGRESAPPEGECWAHGAHSRVVSTTERFKFCSAMESYNQRIFLLSCLLGPHPRIRLSILEKEEGRETNVMWERSINRLPPIRAPTGDRTCNPGMCPDQD